MNTHYVLSIGDDIVPQYNDTLVGFPIGETYVAGAKGNVSTTDIDEVDKVFNKVLWREFDIGGWQVGKTLLLCKCDAEHGQKTDVSNLEVLRSGVIGGG